MAKNQDNGRDIEGPPIPKDIEEKLIRGRKRMNEASTKRNECVEFWRGNQFVHVNSDETLVQQNTYVGSKPNYRMRKSWNLIHGMIEAKVSASTQKIPSYEISPSTTDPEDEAASKIAEKVALYGYDKWGIGPSTKNVVTWALVTGEGFAMPYFDSTIPPFIDEKNGIGMGDIRIKVIGPNECYWEPGVEFKEAKWHAVEQARSIEEVEAMPNFIGIKLSPNSERTKVLGSSAPTDHNLVLVTEYLERPSAKFPRGRKMVFCDDQQIVPTENYPCSEDQSYTGPVIHKLSYTQDPSNERDRGVVEHLLDPQRAFNYANNRALEWIQLAISPQVVVAPGILGRQRITTQPGAVYEVPDPQNNFKWRDVPPMPAELRMMKQDAQAAMNEIAANSNIPNQIESAKAIQSVIERDSNRWQQFLANLADFHSDLMHHCLTLVQKYYTEPRLIKVRGKFGPEAIEDFRGADLSGQADVRVLPGSIEPLTQSAKEARVQYYASMGWISPQAAMAAIQGGTAEDLIQDYEEDMARAYKVIRKIKSGPDILFNVPPRIDNQTGEEVPGWMPREFDNVKIQKQVFERWMKSDEWDNLPPELQHASDLYYEGLKMLEAQQQAREAAAQAAMAEGLGMSNAAKGPSPKPLPDTKGIQNQSDNPNNQLGR